MRISFEELQALLEKVLSKHGFAPDRAASCARVFAENSRDGVASHGLNRFVGFVEMVKLGHVKPDAVAQCDARLGAWEQWDGQLGPGISNALACTERTLELAHEHGIGCVGLRNTNHWMRGGTYGRRAAEAGFGMLCWTNTSPNMPAWGGRTPKLGNNPLVVAAPRAAGPLVLDMALSQFSYGKLETLRRSRERLPVPGGFDEDNQLTTDPAAILKTERGLPVGYWKGAGLSLLLDVLAVVVSAGRSTHQIAKPPAESGLSQVFIAFDVSKSEPLSTWEGIVNEILANLSDASELGEARYPGARVLEARKDSFEHGVPVDPEVYSHVVALLG